MMMAAAQQGLLQQHVQQMMQGQGLAAPQIQQMLQHQTMMQHQVGWLVHFSGHLVLSYLELACDQCYFRMCYAFVTVVWASNIHWFFVYTFFAAVYVCLEHNREEPIEFRHKLNTVKMVDCQSKNLEDLEF